MRKLKFVSVFVLLALLLSAGLGCEGRYQPPSTPLVTPAASLTPLPLTLQPTAATPTRETTSFPEDSVEEKQAMLTAEPTPTPSFPDLPDLTPPFGGWIAFKTPGEQLALISPDDSQRISLTERGTVGNFAWSPDGRSFVFVRDRQLVLLSIEDARFIPLTPPGAVRSTELAWSQDSRHLAYLHSLGKGSRSVAPDALRVLDVAPRSHHGQHLHQRQA